MSQEATAKKDAIKKSSKPGEARTDEPSLNLAEIREIAEMVEQYGFTDFEFENEKIRVRLSKNVAPQMIQAAPQYAPSYTEPAAPRTESAPPAKAETPAPAEDENLFKITSPIVGTFYRSPSPDKAAYVKEGDTVAAETVVCIVEAMKLMNEIQAEATGEIVKIYVENGQPVEYGQPLFGIKQ